MLKQALVLLQETKWNQANLQYQSHTWPDIKVLTTLAKQNPGEQAGVAILSSRLESPRRTCPGPTLQSDGGEKDKDTPKTNQTKPTAAHRPRLHHQVAFPLYEGKTSEKTSDFLWA